SCSKHGKAAVRNLARLYYLSRSTLKFLLFSESRRRSRFNRADLDAAAGLFAKDCRNHGRQVGPTSEKEMRRARFRNRNLELFSNANRRWPRWLTRPRRVETGELPDCGSPSREHVARIGFFGRHAPEFDGSPFLSGDTTMDAMHLA